jgi:hypothetical protein
MIDDVSIDRFISSSRYRISHRFNDHIDRLNVTSTDSMATSMGHCFENESLIRCPDAQIDDQIIDHRLADVSPA